MVTGGGGFVGQWLARALLQRGDEVWLTGKERARPETPAILTSEEWKAARWMTVDIRQDRDVARMLGERPDVVFHLAGISHVPEAEGAPAGAFDVNVTGSVRLLAAAAASLRAGSADPLMIVVGSGTQYGVHDDSEMPLDESAEQRPIGWYAATKAAQEIAALQVGRASGLRVVCTRSFSHSGIGHAPVFLIPSLIRRIRELGPDRMLRVGNDVVRDYLHVTDAVSAYVKLADGGRPQEAYNICSGVGVSVRQLATRALQMAGVEANVTCDDALRRRADMPVLVGSPEKLVADTGWRPTRTYEDILADFLVAPVAR